MNVRATNHREKLLLLLQQNMILLQRRFKKRYASLHNQERQALILPNTHKHSVSLPHGIKICSSLKEFKVRNIKGGFQRRPELICQRDADDAKIEDLQHLQTFSAKSTRKIERIQNELVQTALKLLQDIKFDQDERLVINQDKIGIKGNINTNNRNECISPLVLDLGCGHGYSMVPLLDAGYACIGVDLDLSGLNIAKNEFLSTTERKLYKSKSQLQVQEHTSPQNTFIHNSQQFSKSASTDAECYLGSPFSDLVRWDLRYGVPFKANSFDLAISMSFLQWLFHGKQTETRLKSFFKGLRRVLCHGGKAVIQFYPQNTDQVEKALHHALPYFQGVLVGDYPHLDRGRKLFLILYIPFHVDR